MMATPSRGHGDGLLDVPVSIADMAIERRDRTLVRAVIDASAALKYFALDAPALAHRQLLESQADFLEVQRQVDELLDLELAGGSL